MTQYVIFKDKTEDWSSTEGTNIVDYLHSISSTPKDHVWTEEGIIDEDFDVVIKTNVKRVKRASRAGNSRRVKLMQDRRNNRLDDSNSLENSNHHKHEVKDN
uniref:Chromo domain-containing protein n=1 Tax=Loa loa TaxID=7209 RepID=A0A1I7VDH3_LOALO